MKILHLAAGNRWTGAAAPAFAEVEALRQAGVDAHYAYVGGYKLQEKLAHCDFAHPLIEKAQNPMSFRRSVQAIDRMINRHGFDVVHAHLTYDHWLARFATRDRHIRMARTFHSRRTLRTDPFTKSLAGRTDHLFVVNDSFRDAALLRGRNPIFTPPPVDTRQFRPDGDNVRAAYGIAPGTAVVAAIGKLSPGRGFEDALRAFSFFRAAVSNSRMMIIGHGPHRPALEALTRDIGVADAVIWTGYHEHDLAEHYRAADILLFTAAGSDEGHRAVLEAMACGVIPVSLPLPGMDALLGTLASRLIAGEKTAQSAGLLAAQAISNKELLRAGVMEQVEMFTYDVAARTLLRAYGT
jgi:glycosyltransferase involved in cell wall biosynthesis